MVSGFFRVCLPSKHSVQQNVCVGSKCLTHSNTRIWIAAQRLLDCAPLCRLFPALPSHRRLRRLTRTFCQVFDRHIFGSANQAMDFFLFHLLERPKVGFVELGIPSAGNQTNPNTAQKNQLPHHCQRSNPAQCTQRRCTRTLLF